MTTVLQGKVKTKRNRGRPPTSYMNNITDSSGLELIDVVHRSRDREDWRSIVAKSVAPNDVRGDVDR